MIDPRAILLGQSVVAERLGAVLTENEQLRAMLRQRDQRIRELELEAETREETRRREGDVT